ncbi:MAG: hypothetical protein IJ580_01185 [Prevotella sp.]|nr:hypothetical protein [Prevotella sp.]
MKKRSLLILMSFIIATPLLAQGGGVSKKAMKEEYMSFRRECMKEYIQFVREAWKEYEGEPPVKTPKDQDLPLMMAPMGEGEEAQPVPQTDSFFSFVGNFFKTHKPKTEVVNKQPKETIVNKVVSLPPPPPPVQAIEKVYQVKNPEEKKFNFSLFGTDFSIRIVDNENYKVKSLTEDDVADALEILGSKLYDNTLYDCLLIRSKYKLSDWAYFQLVQEFTNRIFGKDTNEATLMLSYIVTNSGYKTRLAHNKQRLILLLASNHIIYERVYWKMDGVKYYPLVESTKDMQLMISGASFPKEAGVSFYIPNLQQFNIEPSEERVIEIANWPELRITVHTNKNLLSFYNTYLTSHLGDNIMTRWAMYANTPMAKEVRDELYPQLQQVLAGLNQHDSVDRLLRFLQFGFPYMLDDKVWGHDRAFFAEETLFYPYSDCEDHAILFSRLVRDLLHLKTILVYYSGKYPHLATAVHFDEDVNGDYIYVGNEKYIVCDPTYLNGHVGMTHPYEDNSQAQVILLD